MKYFIDTEFIQYKKDIDLISIGIVSEDNRQLYYITYDFDETKASQWVKDNVINHVKHERKYSSDFIQSEILKFIGNDNNIELWGNYCAYDFVIFSQLMSKTINSYNPMVDHYPSNYPYYINDLQQLITDKSFTYNTMNLLPHHALYDALEIKNIYNQYIHYQNNKPLR